MKQSDFRYINEAEIVPTNCWIANNNGYNLYVFFKGQPRAVFVPPHTVLAWEGDYVADRCETHAKNFMVAINYIRFESKNKAKKECTCGSDSVYGDTKFHADYCDKYS